MKNLAFPAVGAFGIFASIVIISLTYGFEYRFSEHLLYYESATALFLAVQLVSAWAYLRIAESRFERTGMPSDHIGFLMVSISLLLSLFFYSNTFSPVPWFSIALPVCLVGYLLFWKWGLRAGTLFLVLIGLAFNLFLVEATPDHFKGSNMLPIIEAAIRRFLSGDHPYGYYRDVSAFKFVYLPGLWIPYAPFVVADLDLRLLNIIAFIIIVLIFEISSRSNPSRGTLAFAIYPMLLSPPIAQMIIYGHVWPYWVFLLFTALCLHQGDLLKASLLFGLTLATRQPAIFFIAPFAVYIYRQWGFPALIKYGMLSIVVYLAAVLPFSLTASEGGWASWYLLHYSGASVDPNQIGASPYMRLWGLGELSNPLQAIVLLVTTIAVWRFPKRPLDSASRILYIVGLGYIGFIFFNTYVVRYLYVPGFLLMAFSLTHWTLPSLQASRARSTN